MGTIISITAGRPQLEQQAREALLVHYAKKGLKGDELTQTVDRCMAVQFKARPEYLYVSLEEMQQIADTKRRIDEMVEREIEEDERETLLEMEPLSQSIN